MTHKVSAIAGCIMTISKISSPHPTGGNRAYKKISGKEHDFHSINKNEADEKQAEFESIADLSSKKVFTACGRFIGFRLTLRKNAGRKPSISMRKEIGKYNAQDTKENTYNGSFEDLWSWTKTEWKTTHHFLPMDVYAYRDEIKIAKRLYMSDLASHLDKIEGTD